MRSGPGVTLCFCGNRSSASSSSNACPNLMFVNLYITLLAYDQDSKWLLYNTTTWMSDACLLRKPPPTTDWTKALYR